MTVVPDIVTNRGRPFYYQAKCMSSNSNRKTVSRGRLANITSWSTSRMYNRHFEFHRPEFHLLGCEGRLAVAQFAATPDLLKFPIPRFSVMTDSLSPW